MGVGTTFSNEMSFTVQEARADANKEARVGILDIPNNDINLETLLGD
jgi:hypothetical protein